MMEPNPVFWLASRGGDEKRPYLIVTEYRQPVFNVAPTLDRVLKRLAEAGFAQIEYIHPGIHAGDGANPDLVAFASQFPLWDFCTFITRPDQ